MDQLSERHHSYAQGLTKRKADKILQMNLYNMQTMKNRLRVLSSKANYNKFKQQYRTERIERHNSIHQQAIRHKQTVEKILGSRGDSQEKYQKNTQLKSQLKEKMNIALARLRESKEKSGNQVKQSSLRIKEVLATKRADQLMTRRQKRQEVLKMQSNAKQTLLRYSKQKRQDLIGLKSQETGRMTAISSRVQRELEAMAEKERQLLELNSQSLNSSRLVEQQYNQLYQKSSKKIRLPSISKSKEQSATTLAD